jgi:hypothetical protein
MATSVWAAAIQILPTPDFFFKKKSTAFNELIQTMTKVER